MLEVIRFFRIGIVNLLGLTVPGALILYAYMLGFVIPAAVVLSQTCHELPWEALRGTARSLAWTIGLCVLVIAYLLGFLLRLSAVDDLDQVSAAHVLTSMERNGIDPEADPWAVWEPRDRFPYTHFVDYLGARITEGKVEDYVTWKGDDAVGAKRSKTAVNFMKLKIRLGSPELASIIDSNEAHIRLLFGTWKAIALSWWPLGFGVVISAVVVSIELWMGGGWRARDRAGGIDAAPLLLIGVATGTTLVGAAWAKRAIEELFHYQRVRELTHIVFCHYLVREMANKKQVPAEPIPSAGKLSTVATSPTEPPGAAPSP